MTANLLKAFEIQSDACARLGAAFSAGVLRHAVEDIRTGQGIAHLLTAWGDVGTEQAVRDALALRFLASLHYLVLSGRAPELAACYPPAAADPARAWAAARGAIEQRPQVVLSLLEHEPQTNEVGRSACLLGGFMTIAAATNLPLRCFELGASAGLNSMWDQYYYVLGDQAWGATSSPVSLHCRWEGAVPRLQSPLVVAERHACDRRPIDLQDLGDATRLLSYCWAEQVDRMDRLRAAIALTQSHGIKIQSSPASEWVGLASPVRGAATVVFHSLAWQYMPVAEQAAIHSKLQAHAAEASAEAPFFWLRMELNEQTRKFELRLSEWNQGDDRLLAVVHPHGEFASWL